MGYQWEYDNARGRYEDACIGINDCNRKIYDLEKQRQSKINQINQLNSDIKNTQAALTGAEELINNESGLKQTVNAISDATNEASENFIRMIEADSVNSKDLCAVYGDEMSRTKETLEDIFNTLKEKRTDLNSRLSDLIIQLNTAKSDLQDIENQLHRENSMLQDLNHMKRSAANDMEYYRRKVQEEEGR